MFVWYSSRPPHLAAAGFILPCLAKFYPTYITTKEAHTRNFNTRFHSLFVIGIASLSMGWVPILLCSVLEIHNVCDFRYSCLERTAWGGSDDLTRPVKYQSARRSHGHITGTIVETPSCRYYHHDSLSSTDRVKSSLTGKIARRITSRQAKGVIKSLETSVSGILLPRVLVIFYRPAQNRTPILHEQLTSLILSLLWKKAVWP